MAITTTTRARTVTVAKAAASYSDDDEIAHLPSKQTWEVLTSLLYQTVLPLAKTTTFAYDVLFTILTSTADQRRKISRFDSKECLAISYGLLTKSPETIMKTVIFNMGVERWVIASFVNRFLSGLYRPRRIQVDATYYFSQDALVRHVRSMYEVYTAFRVRVCERFTKLSDSQAAKNHWQKEQFGLTSSLDDNKQNYFLSVARAIDKLYPGDGGGTLGTYVMQWLANSAGSNFAQYNGEAFTLSRPVRKEIHDGKLHINNKAYSLEGAENIPAPEENAVTLEDNSMLAQVIAAAQSIPSVSLTMLLHGFKTIPTPALRNDIQRHMTMVEGFELSDSETLVNSIPMPDMDDLPTILPLSRSSRKNTLSQQRRREALKIRKEM
ncbi:hypothetical protein EVB87_240 [Rhizobium phage RHph_N28_1]|nr:hypothetical protein EVB87_240 [Rhizobium phage RHph_N28_1]QIG74269.1 hypothetical protein EVC07_241 [Rhizobium phage RHph_N42]QXV73929.1 hypothetical protein [Rhizobium phage RHph_N46]